MYRFWTVLLLGLLFLAHADAQTAEDTVVFILYGVQDGTQQYRVKFELENTGLQMQRSLEATWRRKDNGTYIAVAERSEYSSTLRILVYRQSNCAYRLVVSSVSHTGDRDRDDENQVTIDFSKISSIVYRAPKENPGIRETFGPLHITTSAANAICIEQRFELDSPNVRTKTNCLTEGQHLFPTVLPFYGLTRPLNRHEAAISFFKQKFCPMKAS